MTISTRKENKAGCFLLATNTNNNSDQTAKHEDNLIAVKFITIDVAQTVGENTPELKHKVS